MPYCTNCGTEMPVSVRFCAHCGAPQPAAHSVDSHDFLSGISDRAACILCYVPMFGIAACIVFLIAQRFRRNYRVRFHAFQGLYLFVAWLIVDSAVPGLFYGFGHPEHVLYGFLKLGLIIAWIYMLVQTSQQRDVRLPILGDLAARSTHEQL